MSTSLFEISVASYLQCVGGVENVLKKGAEHAAAEGGDVDALVGARLHETMAPLHFQIVSVVHHSLGAVRGLRAGEFRPPAGYPEKMDYAGLQSFLAEAHAELKTMTPEDIDALADKPMFFRMSNVEIPFTPQNFVLSFSLPNLYFHATTAYDLLRMQGVNLGKTDYLGWLRKG